jgi:hypothetical protein
MLVTKPTNLKDKIMIVVKSNSNIAKILAGKTRGYHQWYIRHIFSNRSQYKIQD